MEAVEPRRPGRPPLNKEGDLAPKRKEFVKVKLKPNTIKRVYLHGGLLTETNTVEATEAEFMTLAQYLDEAE